MVRQTAMPMLAPSSMATPPTSKGLESAPCSRVATSPSAPRLGGGDQHGELVAAQAGEDVAAAQRAAQAGGDLDEQTVALLVTQRVVDLLEAIEVDEQQRGQGAVALRGGQRALAELVAASERLGRPVRASWLAWWRRRREARATVRNSVAQSASRPPTRVRIRIRVSDAIALAVGA